MRLYDAVSRRSGRSTRQLRRRFGLTEAELTARWRQRLQDLAAQSTDGAEPSQSAARLTWCQPDASPRRWRSSGRSPSSCSRCCWSRGTRSRAGRCTRRRRPRCSRPSRSSAPRTSRGPSGSSSWASLAVSLAVACVLGFTRDRQPARGPGARSLVVAGRGRGRRARRGRPARHPAVRDRAAAPGARATACRTRPGARTPSTWPRASAVEVVGHLDRCWWCSSASPVGGRAPGPRSPACSCGGAGDARLVRLPAAGRAAVQPLRAAAGRPAADPDPRAGRPGGRAGRRRAGGRRVATYDDAERLRVRLRVVAPGGRLRQPGRRRRRRDEILSVVAHELGHARHDDVLTGSLLGRGRRRCSASACWGC